MGQGPGYPLPVPCRISATAEKGLRWSKIHTSQRKSERGRDRGRRGGRRARGGRARMESRTREHPRGGEGAGGVGGMEGGNKQIGYRLGEALMLSQGTCIAGKAGETSLGDGEDCAALECRCKVRSPKTLRGIAGNGQRRWMCLNPYYVSSVYTDHDIGATRYITYQTVKHRPGQAHHNGKGG